MSVVKLARWVRSPAGALAVFVAFLAGAAPLIVFRFASHRWFLGDEWVFLAHRSAGSVGSVLKPYNGHWVSVPLVTYRALFDVFGIQSYLPYLVSLVALHLGVVVLLRILLRRLGVRPWPSTLTVVPLVLFGGGADNIVWAFQLTFTGALLFGLAQLLVADHDGPLGPRDAFGVLLGLLSLACSAVALPLLAANSASLLVRRGWRRALAHTAPLASVYLAWAVVYRPAEEVPVGPPPLQTVLAWVRHAISGVFLELGSNRFVAFALLILLAIGGTWAIDASCRGHHQLGADGQDGDLGPRRLAATRAVARDLIVPAALLGAILATAAMTARTRWVFGVSAARSSRYLYVYVALLLPALGVAVQAVLDRWRYVAPLVAFVLLAGVPGNATSNAFQTPPFGDRYFAEERRLVTTIVRIPEARQVPGGTTLSQGAFQEYSPTIGFLLNEVDRGRLIPSQGAFRPLERGGLVLRLGVVDSPTTTKVCDRAPRLGPYAAAQEPRPGARYRIKGAVLVTLLDSSDTAISPPLRFEGTDTRPELVVQLPDLRLRLAAGPGGSVRVCGG